MPPAFAFHRPRRVPVRPRAAALLLLGAGLGLACHLDDLLRAPPPPDQQQPPPQEEAVRLTFSVQPGTARAHAPITPAVEVTAVDQSGGTVPDFAGEIEVDLAANPEDAALAGTTSRRAVRGRAVFDDLTLDEAGDGYRLVARADGVAPATSAPFDVGRRDPDDLLSVGGNDQTDTVLATLQPYVVRVTDDRGNPVSGIQVLWVAQGNGGSVNPAATVTDDAGEARTSHTLGTAAGEYRAVASCPALPNATVTFTATARAGTAVALMFTQQPTDTERRRRISPPVTVTAKDAFGNTATGYHTRVTMDIAPGTGTPGARLDGDRTRDPSNGTATFNDLTIEDAGFGYRLLATSGTLSVISDPFNVLLLEVAEARPAPGWTVAAAPEPGR